MAGLSECPLISDKAPPFYTFNGTWYTRQMRPLTLIDRQAPDFRMFLTTEVGKAELRKAKKYDETKKSNR